MHYVFNCIFFDQLLPVTLSAQNMFENFAYRAPPTSSARYIIGTREKFPIGIANGYPQTTNCKGRQVGQIVADETTLLRLQVELLLQMSQRGGFIGDGEQT